MPRALIVDADNAQQLVFSSLLKRRAYEAVHTKAEDAHQYKTRSIDIIFYLWGKGPLDEMSARRLRTTFQTVPIIIASAHAFPKDRVQALQVGADEFLSIPFTVEHFDEVLNSWVRESRSA
jgi:two-component system KDP operon response regulator KdpE